MKSLTLATLTADDDAIKTAFSISDNDATYSGGGLDGVLGQLTLNPPRKLTLKNSASTGAYDSGSKITVTGTDSADAPLTEDLILTSTDGGETVTGSSAFKTVDSIVAEPQTSTAGVFKVGVQLDGADTNAIKLSIASSAAPAVYTSVDWDGVIGADPMVPARRITGSKITFVGFDASLAALNEFITIVGTDGTESLTTVGAFHTITSITIEAQADTSGAFEFGVVSNAADDDAIITFGATTGATHIFTGDDIDGVIGITPMSPARTVTVKTTAVTAGYVIDSSVMVSGRDTLGRPTSEMFTIGDADGGETLVGDIGFTVVTAILVEPQALIAAEFKIGVRDYTFSDPPLGLRFGAVGNIKVGYGSGTDIIPALIVGEHLPVRPTRIYCTADTTTSKVTLVF